MRFKLKALLMLTIPFLIWGLERFCHRQTDGFSRQRMESSLSFDPVWEVEKLDPAALKRVQTILNQKFFYLARGAQAYAFVSEDGLYVLKCFQHYRMRPPFWSYLLPSSFSETKITRRRLLLEADFASYKIAYEKLKNETGLLFLHLNKSDYLDQKVIFVDNLGIHHEVSLDNIEFLLQKRGKLALPTIEDLMKEGSLKKAQEAIEDLVHLTIERSKKGIFDKDPDFATNFGFHEGKAIQIDVGRFSLDPTRSDPEVYKVDLIHATDPLIKWLESHYPILSKHLINYRQTYVEKKTD